jgi:UDP-N-acetylmuramoyl-tripeptide--D-alanyl-D-alanine ligase
MRKIIRSFWQLSRKVLAKLKVAYGAYVEDGVLSADIVIRWLNFWARFILAAKRPFIIGITGSAGKSTTTKMVAAVLSHPSAAPIVGPVGETSNNMNNHDGLPLVILGFDRWFKTVPERLLLLFVAPLRALRLRVSPHYPKVLVLEYGTDRLGYLQPLVDLAHPNIAIITTIGPAHLQGLGSIDGVLKEKSTLIRAVIQPGLTILGEGHEYIDQLESYAVGPVVRVGGQGRVLAERIARLVGRHLQVPDQVINAALANAEGPQHRMDLLKLGQITVIDDSYNANPLSMRLGLDTLVELAPQGSRRVAVLGTMGELGEHAPRYHKEIGDYARRCANLIIGVGEMAPHYAPDRLFADSANCAGQIEALIQPGDCLLIKGAHILGMDQIVKQLRQGAKSQP